MKAKHKGFLLVMIGATFWGVGGTVSQKLFQDFQVEVGWLVAIRLLIAGICLLVVQGWAGGRGEIFRIWKTPASAFSIIVFGIAGMLAVQYTYMASISEGNAAVATLLQYLSPAFIMIYLLLRRQTLFTRQDAWTLTLALTGCFLLLTNGSFQQFQVPVSSVVWGLLSGMALAFYTLYAVGLLRQFASLVIVGWGMTIGGLVLSIFHPVWRTYPEALSGEGYVYLLFVIFGGTMIAFWFYIASLRYLNAKSTSLLSCLEPLSAVLATVFWLQEPFGGFQWVGTLCILAMVIFLTFAEPVSSSASTIQDE